MPTIQSPSVRLETRPDGIALLRVDVSDRPFNVLNRQIMDELRAAFIQAEADSSIKILAILSDKTSGFFAGADLQEFKGVETAADASAISAAGQQLFDRLADLKIPTVAIIHGVCLGGGLELALACDYRIVIDTPTTSIGLPEVRLGILPAWGGTQRLPRVIGIERAIQVILQGKQLDASAAKRWGLADAVSPTQAEALEALGGEFGQRVRRDRKRKRGGPSSQGWRQRLLEGNPIGRAILFKTAKRLVQSKAPDDMPGPFEALESIRVGMARGMSAGLAFEREAIGRLATTTACRNLVTLFFLNEHARKSTEDAAAARKLRKIGVVGAGAMGAGIAQLAAVKGFDVVVQEVNDNALNAGIQKIEVLFQKMVAKGRMTAAEAQQKIAAIGKTTSWQGFDDTDLVIEAVIEDARLKEKVFRELEQRTRPDAILASNTSSLSINQIQSGMNRPERIAGLHFFNPVHKMILVEAVWGEKTNRDLMPVLARFAADLGKTPVVVRDSTGFLVNRILFPYLNEAGLLVAEGMPVESVDKTMRRFGMLMGPLKLLDQIGLDVAAHVARTVAPIFGDRLKSHPGLDQMIQRGWLGQKAGAGFYRYADKKKPTVNEEAKAAMLGNVAPASASDSRDAQERMVLLMVNEAAACLGEGLAESADGVDLAMVLGTGWAPHRGGPLRYADDRGPKDCVHALEALAARLGPRFAPCAELKKYAVSGKKFYDFLEERFRAENGVQPPRNSTPNANAKAGLADRR